MYRGIYEEYLVNLIWFTIYKCLEYWDIMQFLIIIVFFFRVYLQCCYSSALQSDVDESKS